MTADVRSPHHDRSASSKALSPQSSTGSVRRTSRVKHPKVVPPLLQGRDGSGTAPTMCPNFVDRVVTRKLSFCAAESAPEEPPRKRKVSASPSATSESGEGISRDSRGTEVSSSSVYRTTSSQVDRASVVLVTRTLSLRCDSGATSCDPLSGQSRPLSLSDDGRQASVSSAVLNPQNAAAATAATPCSALSHAAAGVALPNMGSSPPAMGCSLGSTPSPLSASPPAQLSFLDWSAALQRCSGNPLARPPLPLDLPGACESQEAAAFPLSQQQSPALQQAASKLSALEMMLKSVTAAEHRARCAAACA